MKTGILFVEDDQFFAKVVKRQLERAGYDVTLCEDGEDGWDHFQKSIYDVCLLDVVMPKKDGFTLARDIRSIDENIPIIFTTSRYMEQDKMQGFECGADDYVTKPFNVQELIYRIEVYVKRSKLLRSEKRIVYTMGNLVFDYTQFNIRHKDSEAHVRMAPKEAELLRFLCENSNKKLLREQILNSVWGQDDFFTKRVMDVYLTRLRKHIAQDPSVKLETYHGKGLMFIINELDRTHMIAKA
ncbi:response regulator transcription factor [Chitinophaga nivalis]|uniref:Response regulator transcription factor n=1 Tax=Chitinophaga nivalis TaxID=2991709 RepID=A0ABT3IF23_9BACT|nr:response regulator transcription factor [Chitinophaga nivalis]MCW3467751.1 response regulator transcription factor [Chitinophaga nivalis]MCW3482557.1 response regulator transcription factor [Chitinophaga nivalis]